MTYHQDPFLVDRFQDEAYFTNFTTDDDEQNLGATKYLNPWSMPTGTPQLQPEFYTTQSSSIDGSYTSPYLEPFESPFVGTIQPAQLQTNGFQSPLSRQPYQSPVGDTSHIETKNTSSDLEPLSSPSLADTNSLGTETCLTRSCTTRSSNQQQTKGQPRKKRNASCLSSEDDWAILKAKSAHSVIERRYRDNLNGKMMQLHRILLAAETNQLLQLNNSSLDQSQAYTGKVRKSDIMTRAITYIHQSEDELQHMTDEIRRLQEQVRMFQKLVQCEIPRC